MNTNEFKITNSKKILLYKNILKNFVLNNYTSQNLYISIKLKIN